MSYGADIEVASELVDALVPDRQSHQHRSQSMRVHVFAKAAVFLIVLSGLF